MLTLVHHIAAAYLRRRMSVIRHFMEYPHEVQAGVFRQLIQAASFTAWGKAHGYQPTMSVDSFRANVPINAYEQLYPWIERSFRGERDVLWRGKVNWYAQSSGTTNDRSKFIPITPESLEECHFQVGRDMLTMYFEQVEGSQLFTGNALSIGGSHRVHPAGNGLARSGDLSAILTENLPTFYSLLRVPSRSVALMSDWEPKIEAIIRETFSKNITSMSGVPTWTLVLLHRMLEVAPQMLGRNVESIAEIWQNIEVFFHGGVNFDPYRAQFRQLIPTENMRYMECYNASEGFFGLGDVSSSGDMLLMLDYGVFYEFLPIEQLENLSTAQTLLLHEVELGKHYALVISTNGGLWRYLVGDTIVFTQKEPYRFRISGRTKHYINVFGEELMVENADRAIAAACVATHAQVQNYTAAPVYFDLAEGGLRSGAHEWLIEFDTPPQDFSRFCEVLDSTLKSLNSDYEAKRHKDMALRPPMVRVMPQGTFYEWMRRRNKLGGQHKVPRLCNSRQYVEDILKAITV